VKKSNKIIICRITLFLSFLTFFKPVWCQYLQKNASIDAAGFYPAPAVCVPFYSAKEINFSYSVPFGIKELSTRNLSVLLPFSMLGVTVIWENFGENLYNENTLETGIGIKIKKEIALGVTGRYRKTEIEGYSSLGEINCDAGICWFFRESFMADIQACNLFQDETATLNRLLQCNVKYFPYDNYFLKAGIVQEEGFSREYYFENNIVVKNLLIAGFGGSLNPGIFRGSLIFRIGDFFIGYSFADHKTLGNTHKFLFSYDITADRSYE